MSGPATRLSSPEAVSNVNKLREQSDNPRRLSRTTSKKSLATPSHLGKSKIPKHEKGRDGTAAGEIGSASAGAVDYGDEQQLRRRPTSRSQQFVTQLLKEKPGKRGKPSASALSTLNASCAQNQVRALENRFKSKRNHYTSLKSEIEDKQKLSESSFEELLAMREQILASGGKDPGNLERLAPLPAWSVRQLRATATRPESEEQSHLDHLDEGFVTRLEAALKSSLDCLLDFCSEACGQRSAALATLLELSERTPAGMEPSAELKYLKQELSELGVRCRAEGQALEGRLEASRQAQASRVAEIVRVASLLWHELRAQRRLAPAVPLESADASGPVSQELSAERARSLKARTKQLQLGAELRQAQEAGRQLEAQLRQKEASCEQRSKELARIQRTAEQMHAKLERQRALHEQQMRKLREELGSSASQSLASEHQERLASLESELGEERRAREEAEATLRELEARNEKLEDKCRQMLEMQEGARRGAVTDDKHTEYEIQLFNELKETQKLLGEREELIKRLQIEREEIMAAASAEDAEDDADKRERSRQWLTAELLRKSNELQAMTSELTRLQKSHKKLQQQNERMQQSLGEMTRLQKQLREPGSGLACHEAQLLQLQQKVSEMRASLAEARAYGAELEKTCTRLQLKLGHQGRELRLRGELQQLLRPQDQEAQPRQPEPEDEQLQQLCAALESKELQVGKLEKLIKQMEKQEEFAQQQRTRLEGRIARLEALLRESEKTHRNRGFSFL